MRRQIGAGSKDNLMPSIGELLMSVKFFRNDRTLCMFDPDTYKIHLYQCGTWIESNDLQLREDIRFRSVELSRKEVLRMSGLASLQSLQ